MALASIFVGCSSSEQANANQTITTTGPDNSEIVTTTDSTGTKTETRTFRNNPRVSRVVVTTRDGRRTVKVYSKTDRKSTRLNSSHSQISYAVFCLKKKKKKKE